jgi:hypothetical protein
MTAQRVKRRLARRAPSRGASNPEVQTPKITPRDLADVVEVIWLEHRAEQLGRPVALLLAQPVPPGWRRWLWQACLIVVALGQVWRELGPALETVRQAREDELRRRSQLARGLLEIPKASPPWPEIPPRRQRRHRKPDPRTRSFVELCDRGYTTGQIRREPEFARLSAEEWRRTRDSAQAYRRRHRRRHLPSPAQPSEAL